MAKSDVKVKKGVDLLFELSRPFDQKDIEWRVGRLTKTGDTMVLAYVNVRTVQDRLNEVMGCDWQCKHINYGVKTICHLGLKLDGEWVWRSDGAGDTQFEADKGGISDALKRASVAFGIGRHLYDLGNVFIKPTDFKKNKKGEYTKIPDPQKCWERVRQKNSDFS
jgi:hypothetical protein